MVLKGLQIFDWFTYFVKTKDTNYAKFSFLKAFPLWTNV
jgi:hypothetical protein